MSKAQIHLFIAKGTIHYDIVDTQFKAYGTLSAESV